MIDVELVEEEKNLLRQLNSDQDRLDWTRRALTRALPPYEDDPDQTLPPPYNGNGSNFHP